MGVCSRRQANVSKAEAELKAAGVTAVGLVCNAGKSDQRKKLVEDTVKAFGKIDVLVRGQCGLPCLFLAYRASLRACVGDQ